MLFFFGYCHSEFLRAETMRKLPPLLQLASPSYHQLHASGCLTRWKRGMDRACWSFVLTKTQICFITYLQSAAIPSLSTHDFIQESCTGQVSKSAKWCCWADHEKYEGSLGVSNLSRIRWKLCLLWVVTFPNLVLSMCYLDQRWASRSWYKEVLQPRLVVFAFGNLWWVTRYAIVTRRFCVGLNFDLEPRRVHALQCAVQVEAFCTDLESELSGFLRFLFKQRADHFPLLSFPVSTRCVMVEPLNPSGCEEQPSPSIIVSCVSFWLYLLNAFTSERWVAGRQYWFGCWQFTKIIAKDRNRYHRETVVCLRILPARLSTTTSSQTGLNRVFLAPPGFGKTTWANTAGRLNTLALCLLVSIRIEICKSKFNPVQTSCNIRPLRGAHFPVNKQRTHPDTPAQHSLPTLLHTRLFGVLGLGDRFQQKVNNSSLATRMGFFFLCCKCMLINIRAQRQFK